jgi:hypothetical protein
VTSFVAAAMTAATGRVEGTGQSEDAKLPLFTAAAPFNRQYPPPPPPAVLLCGDARRPELDLKYPGVVSVWRRGRGAARHLMRRSFLGAVALTP